MFRVLYVQQRSRKVGQFHYPHPHPMLQVGGEGVLES